MKIERAVKYLDLNFFSAFGFIVLTSIFSSIYFENIFILCIPIIIITAFFVFFDYKFLYYFLIFSLPLSIHYTLNGNLAVDFFSEPLMILLLCLLPFILLKKNISLDYLKHPIVFLILAQLIWAIFTSIYSVSPLHSAKYILAKLWYIASYIFITGILLKNIEDFKKIFWLFFLPMLFVAIITLSRHSTMGFSFDTANKPMLPFFHNHVLYSSMLAIFIPFAWYARGWYKKHSLKRVIVNSGIIILLLGIGFSYTRASWMAVILAIPAYFIIKYKLTRFTFYIGCIALIVALLYMNHQNKYLNYSVEYKKVIFHKGNIEKHLAATYKMQDVSGMERIYRWMAAKNMISENPILGSGPNTFYPEYKRYTINSFSTYVSDNPERSTTHNYFLMIFCEQGIIGFLLFAGLYAYLLLLGSRLHSQMKDQQHKNLATACALSLIILLIHLALNDLIETDKIGSLFFITCMVLVKLDLWNKKSANQEIAQEI
jgi:O-antigen ligase